ncbi:MAG: hypothetical protein AAGD00_05325 [Planctomycetota bacterium]
MFDQLPQVPLLVVDAFDRLLGKLAVIQILLDVLCDGTFALGQQPVLSGVNHSRLSQSSVDLQLGSQSLGDTLVCAAA